jgi:predicted outer membrane repeat protein
MVGNNAAFTAGAIHCQAGSSPSITGCVFADNTASSGGALGSSGAAPMIDGNTFTGNRGGDFGGAIICALVSTPVISNNTFTGNHCRAGPGGAIFCVDASPTIERNVFFQNSAGTSGGAIACSGVLSAPVIRYNTLSENGALVWGGGVYANDANPIIQHTIIVFSSSGPGIGCAGVASPFVSCSDIFGNAGGDVLCGVDAGGNISADPQFCGSIGTGNFKLQSDSPCAPANNGCGDYMGATHVGCGSVAVRETSWGGVKALYR